MSYYIYIVPLIILICILVIIFWYKKEKKKKSVRKEIKLPEKKYDSYHVISDIYLVYYVGEEENYLTWRYAGNNLLDKKTYNLVLLPYKNKQNEFKIHLQDYHYLKKFYENYELVSDRQVLDKIVFATSDYNENSDQYLELELDEDNKYLVKASLWLEKGPFAYLHIDNKNKLYFDDGIHENIVRVIIK